MHKILVQKFGGTSVDSDQRRRQAAMKVIAARDAGYAPVVVVSAIGRNGAPYATDTLIGLLKGVDASVAPAADTMDVVMACGEIISTAVFSTTLHAMGCPSVAMTGGQAGIVTDGAHGNARITGIDPAAIVHAVEAGLIPVICGFQGVAAPSDEGQHGAITTLGRGGSDTTAAALGAALKACAVEIYTDVDGVKTADPDMVPGARTLEVCTYAELAEITHLGAKVVHPRAAEIAMDHGIPLWVKSTFSDAPGTCIMPTELAPEVTHRRVTGISHSGRGVFIRLEITNEADKPEVEQEVYRLMGRAGVNIFLPSFSPAGFSFAVTREMYYTARDLLDGMVVPVGSNPNAQPASRFYIFKFSEGLDLAYSAQRPLLRPIEQFIEVIDVPGTVWENVTMVSVVAAGHRELPGIIARVYDALTEAGIQVLQVTDSDMSISCLIPETDAPRAVSLLHSAFGLEG